MIHGQNNRVKEGGLMLGMTKVTLKLLKTNENGLKYTGDADKYLSLPITIDDKVIGLVT